MGDNIIIEGLFGEMRWNENWTLKCQVSFYCVWWTLEYIINLTICILGVQWICLH